MLPGPEKASEGNLLQVARLSMALVLAGGRGARLKMLTDRRAKPAVHFGGKFRIIDFALSNCLNSGIRRISVLTQYKSHSLLRHLQRGWNHLRGDVNEFVELLPAQQRIDETSWYRGTADAVYQNLDILRSHRVRWVLILAGDHVYRMDYAAMLRDHISAGADCTVACMDVPRAGASAFGIVATDADRRIVQFLEKPEDPPPMPGRPDRAYASMGIYVFNTDFLFDALTEDAVNANSSHDFGTDIIPRIVGRSRVVAHNFSDSCVKTRPEDAVYWRDVGTLDAYWQANIDLIQKHPSLDLYDPNWPIFTYQEQLPPAWFNSDLNGRQGTAVDSMVSGGCVVAGGTVRRSLLFSRVFVGSGAVVEDSVVLPGVRIGAGARIRRAIIDRGVLVPDGFVFGEDPAADCDRFHLSDAGIGLITRDNAKRFT